MVERHNYLNWLEEHRGTPIIKVLTGMRRVGKSTLLQQFLQKLESKGLSTNNVLLIDMEALEFQHIRTGQDLANFVTKYFEKTTTEKVVLIDEVQEIDGWEKTISALLKTQAYDLYITGSNSHLLSSDLATYLAGRYIQIHILTFSYSEYLRLHKEKFHSSTSFQSYIKLGGFPGIYHLPNQDHIRFQALNDLYSSIILRDIVERYAIRNVTLLERIILFFFDNMGQPISARSITAYLKSQNMTVSVESVLNYISYLESCFALYTVKRYNVKGKNYMEINDKHYLGDIGLRHAILGYRQGDIGQILENLVFLELKRRGYTVSTGLIDSHEIDFIATKQNEKLYIQVSYLLASPQTRERELRSLKKVHDAFPKLLLTMDELRQDEEGIQHLYLPDFLTNEFHQTMTTR